VDPQTRLHRELIGLLRQHSHRAHLLLAIPTGLTAGIATV
jgi:hypothetical protein